MVRCRDRGLTGSHGTLVAIQGLEYGDHSCIMSTSPHFRSFNGFHRYENYRVCVMACACFHSPCTHRTPYALQCLAVRT